jgi:hypothetical protein
MKFRKKPVIIEAIHLTEDLFWETYDGDFHKPLPEPFNKFSFCGSFHAGNKTISFAYINISTLEGTMRADLGDWIIKGIKGEFYPCKPDIFEATYEQVI